jgi:glycogen(starch) synthase
MRILLVDYDSPFGPTPGGQFQDTKQLVFPLAKKHSITVLTSGSIPTKHEYPVKYVGLTTGRWRQLAFIWQVRRYVASHADYDLIIEKFTSPIGPIGLPTLTSKPVLAMANFMFWDEMSVKYHLPVNLITRQLLRNYRYVTCYIPSQAKQLKSINPALEVTFMPPTLAALPSLPGRPGDSLLFIGRADIHQKGLDMLVTILNQVNLPEAKIVIAGGLRQLNGYRGTIPIEYVGYLNDRQKAAVFQNARIHLLPSRYETFGLVQLEAAAYGRPTIAFDLPVFADRKSCMVLVTPFDTQQYARQIETLWNDTSAYRKLSQCCRNLAKSYVSTTGTQILAKTVERISDVARSTSTPH